VTFASAIAGPEYLASRPIHLDLAAASRCEKLLSGRMFPLIYAASAF
jgi:hypothetical protein